MISASSSAASGVLSAFFGTGGSGASSTAGSVLGAVEGTGSGSGSAAYVLDGSLAGSDSSLAGFLSNAAFAGVTESLLLDPRANGELTGTASSNVQKIISEIGAAEGAAAAVQAGSDGAAAGAADSSTSSGGLPAGGVVA